MRPHPFSKGQHGDRGAQAPLPPSSGWCGVAQPCCSAARRFPGRDCCRLCGNQPHGFPHGLQAGTGQIGLEARAVPSVLCVQAWGLRWQLCLGSLPPWSPESRLGTGWGAALQQQLDLCEFSRLGLDRALRGWNPAPWVLPDSGE